MVGRIESLHPLPTDDFEVVISYAVETAGNELTQLLNVIFGNTSMQLNIRVERISLPDALLQHYPGPKFGRAGLRKLVQAEHRPLLCTALKPMGLSAKNLAHLARQFALGGIDIVKDDHGLANQPFAPFKERVQRCADAVQTVNQQSGSHCLYVPNITAPAHQILENAYFAKQVGAGGVMVAPGLTGLDAIRQLAQDKNLALPVFSHPALQGTRVVGPRQGMAHQLVFGQLPRLAGADATIYVNYGGRFAFSQADCRAIARATEEPMGH
ncbi:MAG: ribulose 1,5-bisphosphate carboxylase large subunit, partial [Chloroflexi bacterium]